MDKEKRVEIIRKHCSKYPVIIRPLAEELGLNVYYVSNWPDNLSGQIEKDEKAESGYSIYVNSKHPTNRRRFTIAHEIAHFHLHQHLIGDGVTDDGLYRSTLTSKTESEANRMAADILMPLSLIDHAIGTGKNTIEDLAKAFKVSRGAMSIRLGVPGNCES